MSHSKVQDFPKLLREALPLFNSKHVSVTEIDKSSGNLQPVYRIILPYKLVNDDNLVLYASKKKNSNKLYLSDDGETFSNIDEVNAKMKVSLPDTTINNMIAKFGLSCNKENEIVESSDDPLGIRLHAMIGGLLAVDGAIRCLVATKEQQKGK